MLIQDMYIRITWILWENFFGDRHHLRLEDSLFLTCMEVSLQYLVVGEHKVPEEALTARNAVTSDLIPTSSRSTPTARARVIPGPAAGACSSCTTAGRASITAESRTPPITGWS